MGLLHLGRVAARKAASAALGRVIVPAGGLHHLPEVVHHLPAVGLGEAALSQIAAEDGLRKGNILAAHAIADLVSDEERNEDYIIPGAFDARVAQAVADAVARAARESGVARL